jgi:3-oxoadipate enol-lactonase
MSTVKVADINVYYEVHGEGPPLILIPGLRSRVSEYGRVIEILSRTRRVVAADNRGAGGTDKPDSPYSIEMMSDDTAGLMGALDLPRADVLGVSMGGRIALALALRHPRLVRRLVLVSTSSGPGGNLGWSGRLLSFTLRVPLIRKLGRDPQPYAAFVRQREASRHFDCTDRLHELSVPTLIAHGTKDRLVPFSRAEAMHERIRGSKFLALRGGHLVLFFRPQQCADAVEAFLAAP